MYSRWYNGVCIPYWCGTSGKIILGYKTMDGDNQGTTGDNNLTTTTNGNDNNLQNQNAPVLSPTPTPDSGGQGTPTPQDNQGNTGSPENNGGQGQGTQQGSSNQGGQQQVSEADKKQPWFQKRIDALTAEKWEERRKAEGLQRQTEALLSQLAEMRKNPSVSPSVTPNGAQQGAITQPQQPAVTQTQPAVTEAEIEARANSKAEILMRERAFTKACNDVYEAGKNDYDDFDKSLRTFNMVGGLPTPLLETITEMPNAHKVLYALGKDAELTERVVKMPLTKAAMELARIESNLAKPVVRQVSSAPNPVRPLDSSGRVNEDPETMSMQEFVNYREKQLAAKRGGGR